MAILLFLPVSGVCALPISQEIGGEGLAGAVEEVILSCSPLTAETVTPRCKMARRRELSCVRLNPSLSSLTLSERSRVRRGASERKAFIQYSRSARDVDRHERLIILERGEAGHPSTHAGHASAADGMTYGEGYIRGRGSKYCPCKIPSKWELRGYSSCTRACPDSRHEPST